MKKSRLLVLATALLSALSLSATFSLAADPTVTVSNSTVAPGDPVTVTITNAPGGQLTALSLVPVSLPAFGDLGVWRLMGGGVTSLTWTVTMPYAAGIYEVRLIDLSGVGNRVPLAVSPRITQPIASGAGGDLVTFPSKVLEILAGPLTATGTGLYDTAQLIQAQRFIDAPDPGDNFYDYTLALYAIAYRTGKSYWFDRAREVAHAWAAYVLAKSDYITPWDHAPLGIAILATEEADSQAKAAVLMEGYIAAGGTVAYGGGVTPYYGDQRQAAYNLMSFTAAELLGGTAQNTHNNRLMLDALMAQQKGEQLSPGLTPGLSTGPNPYRQTHTDGCWYNAPAEPASGYHITNEYTMNFMNGLILEALALYDRAIGDPRIVPSMQRCVDWMWATQWNAPLQEFSYTNLTRAQACPAAPSLCEITSKDDPTPQGRRTDLNGLILPAWGYLYLKTGDSKYKAQGDQILQGLVNDGVTHINEQKKFAQQFRSSSRYLGYLAQASGALPTPPRTSPVASSTPPVSPGVSSTPPAPAITQNNAGNSSPQSAAPPSASPPRKNWWRFFFGK